ncbi:unnamed protein product [Ectocarpus sp. 12 AP-2014]
MREGAPRRKECLATQQAKCRMCHSTTIVSLFVFFSNFSPRSLLSSLDFYRERYQPGVRHSARDEQM